MRTIASRAEKKARTRDELIAAADRLFTRQGFHATSLDAIAVEAGYTKGAVYSNFFSKEDLFLAMYAVRVAVGVRYLEDLLAEEPDYPAAIERVSLEAAERRGREDEWIAVFFEFWAHVLRHPELRERFAELHAAAIRPVADGMARHARERGITLPDEPHKLATAMYAMQLGLSLERLTQPEVVDAELGARMVRLSMQDLGGGNPR